MDNETLHIAKLLAWPQMRQAYAGFGGEITASLTSPALQMIQETCRNTPELPASPGTALDILTEEGLVRLRRSPKIRGNKIDCTAAKLCQTLAVLRETCERLAPAGTEEKLCAEVSFRTWLERGIVSSAAQEEPSFLADSDPVRKAIGHLQRLKTIPLAFAPKEDNLAFPISSYEIAFKPKTPTAIEVFDDSELDGGAEEDSTLILSGESNIGKSHLGLFCLSSLSLRKEGVLLCSGEDSLETTRKRIFSHYLRRPAKTVAAMTARERMDAFTELYGDREDPQSLHYHIIHHVAITCIPEGGFTPAVIEDRIDQFEQKTQKKVRAFMADYLQKMNDNMIGKNPKRVRDEELEMTMNQIKDICQQRKTFGIVISQVPSHAAGGGTSEFLNLRQAVARSYAATWGAHYVITMNRPAEETKRLANSADKRPRLNLFLCKNKDNPVGTCYTLGHPNEARWEFFRTKAELNARVEAEDLAAGGCQLDPSDYRPQRNLG